MEVLQIFKPIVHYLYIDFLFQMLLNGFSQFTSLVLVVTVLFVCALDLTSARTINDRQITQNEAEIRLGFDGKDLGFERLRRPDNDAFEYQLKNLLLLSKVKTRI